MKFIISHHFPSNRLINIKVEFDQNLENVTTVFLPRWRPGRYVLTDFVQYVRDLKFQDENGVELAFEKDDISSWKVSNNGEKFTANYRFYCHQYDAGSTWIEDDFLYVNPVNCLMYHKNGLEENCEVELNVPEDFELAVGVKNDSKTFLTKTYHELSDNPFFAGSHLQSHRFYVKGVDFGVWFLGECKPDFKKIEKDISDYTIEQFKVMGDFPVEKYEYLYVITPYKKYHGVEHQTSTVIALGPGYDLMTKKYEDFMGVSSHELFHTWNVKNIRPIEMSPYDYQQPNFNKLGYVTEGVTTYYGDLFLKRSQYFNLASYFKELEATFKKHFENDGRFNKSVAQSSYDTWIDGYVPGAPHFKTNIYTEGSLCALMTDLAIRLNGNLSLDTVMKEMYVEFGKKGVGYSEEDYLSKIKSHGGLVVDKIINDHLYGVKDYEPLLKSLLSQFGIEIVLKENQSKVAANFGIILNKDYPNIIDKVSIGSEADLSGFTKGTEITAINGYKLNNRDVESWVEYYNELKTMDFTIMKDGKLNVKTLSVSNEKFYQNRILRMKADASDEERNRLENWLGNLD